jgi:cytoskeletal protein CcmA (bactofilin family)
MFSSKSHQGNKTKKVMNPRDHHAVTILTNGCQFTGKFFCKGSTRIAGRIEGHIQSEGFLVIEEDATIHAEIKAEDTVIQGHVVGKIYASIRVELCPTCRVEGDIVTPLLVIKEGAQFNGHTTMAKINHQQESLALPSPRPTPISKDSPKMGSIRPGNGQGLQGPSGPEIKVPSNQEYVKSAAPDVPVKQII